MPIPIFYITDAHGIVSLALSKKTAVFLTKDSWDDYDLKTTFSVYSVTPTKTQLLGRARIFIEDESRSSEILEKVPPTHDGWHPVTFGERKFISLGVGLNYYENLKRHLPDRDDWESVLSQLHDVVYLEHKWPESPDLELRSNPAFSISLLRGKDATRGYGGARDLLYADDLNPTRFNFTLTFKGDRFASPHVIEFRFDRDSILPTRTIVLIGKNGLGKTQTLLSLIDSLFGIETSAAGEPFSDNRLDRFPPFRSVVTVSFSPFERFPVRAPGPPHSNVDRVKQYHYCGFRTENGWGGPSLAWEKTWHALTTIIQFDLAKTNKSRPKLPLLLRVLRDGLAYESILVPLQSDLPPHFISENISTVFRDKPFLKIDESVLQHPQQTLEALNFATLTGTISFSSKDGLITRFSAGQAMFVFMAFTVVAAIDSASLIIIDEPELCLHPNLIVAYLRMLSTLLDLFESYAVLATHSEFVAREYPSRNVRVFYDGGHGEVDIRPPSIETFGADLSEIANLVFDNITERKPFEEWLDSLVGQGRDFESFKSAYGGSFNSEALTYLRNAFAKRSGQRDSQQ